MNTITDKDTTTSFWDMFGTLEKKTGILIEYMYVPSFYFRHFSRFLLKIHIPVRELQFKTKDFFIDASSFSLR